MELIAARPLARANPQALAIGRFASRTLLRELATFPKPGLVSRVDNGSHADMDASHFARSAFVLRRHFATAASLGAQDADFAALRRWGVTAEVAMGRATGGVNTHRGAIFALGLLCAASGAARATTLGEHVRRRWGEDIAAHRRDPGSHGSAATRTIGAGGAQAQAAAGFPSVYEIALPAHREILSATGSRDAAAVQAFFALLACVTDTNLLHRGGVEGLRFTQDCARRFLDEGGMRRADGFDRALALHHEFVARRLSPGGCADLLAATLFIHDRDPRA